MKYTVKSGDTVYDVAYNTTGSLSSVDQIMDLNVIEDYSADLVAGTILEIPDEIKNNYATLKASKYPFNSSSVPSDMLDTMFGELEMTLGIFFTITYVLNGDQTATKRYPQGATVILDDPIALGMTIEPDYKFDGWTMGGQPIVSIKLESDISVEGTTSIDLSDACEFVFRIDNTSQLTATILCRGDGMFFWGDGTVSAVTADGIIGDSGLSDGSHTYQSVGTYTAYWAILTSGNISEPDGSIMYSQAQRLISINKFSSKLTSVNLSDGGSYGYKSLNSINDILPENVTSFSIQGNRQITSLPALFFSNSKNITSLGSSFLGSAFSVIPTGFFDGLINISSMNSTFSNSGITSIPSGLFDKCTKIVSLIGVFLSCNINSIPNGLFDNLTLLKSVQNIFRSTGLTSIPNNLFVNNKDINDFQLSFYSCTNLTGATPSDTAGKLWERAGQDGYPATINGASCFGSDTGLTDYNDIPANWK